MHALPPNAGAERRGHLRTYLVACLRDSILTPADLASPALVDKLAKAVSADLKATLSDLGRSGGAGALRLLEERIIPAGISKLAGMLGIGRSAS